VWTGLLPSGTDRSDPPCVSADLRGLRWLAQHVYGDDPGVQDADALAYCMALMVCARGDGFLAPEEREWITGLAASLAGPEVADAVAAFEPAGTVQEFLKAKPVPLSARRAIVLDAMRACAADGELREGEWDSVMALASVLGVGETEITAIKKLFRDERSLQERRRPVLFPENLATGQK